LLKNKEICRFMKLFPKEVVAAWPCLAGSWPVLDRLFTEEGAGNEVFPPENLRFSALTATPFASTRVVILGQDPYHGPGQANGLAFSVYGNTPVPPSLKNIFQELQSDCGGERRTGGDLTDWAAQGVLLLNTAWSVAPGLPGSHSKWGWNEPVDCLLNALNQGENRIVFIAWGQHAQNRLRGINTHRHAVLSSAHPSPLGAYRGFWGSKPFSKTNELLASWGASPIDWNGYL
jgi:uracil-DNA glycosylase